MTIKLRSILWIIAFVCGLFVVFNLVRWKEANTEIAVTDASFPLPPTASCGYKDNLIAAHQYTVSIWSGLFRRHFSDVEISFGLQPSQPVGCHVAVNNFSTSFVQSHLGEAPFDQWSYSYQVTNDLILVRAGDQNCRTVNVENVYLCIDYLRSIRTALDRQSVKGIMVWLVPDLITNNKHFISEEYSDFEVLYLYHSLVIRYIMGEGILVVPTSAQVSPATSICNVLSALTPRDTLEASIPLQSAIQSVQPLISLAQKSCNASDTPPPSLHNLCFRHMHTRKYEPRCLPSLKQYEEVIAVMRKQNVHSVKVPDETEGNVGVFPLLITGLGGSGTHNVANLLNGVGIDVAHEGIGTFGSVSWFYAANDWTLRTHYPYGTLYFASNLPYAGLLVPRFHHVLHLVRQPLRQISSVTSHSNFTYNFVMQFMENRAKDEVIDKFRTAHAMQSHCYRGESCHLYFSALSWVYWNRHVRSYADATFQVEDLRRLFQTVCFLAYSGSPADAKSCVEKAEALSKVDEFKSQDVSWWSFLWSSSRYHNADVHKMHLSYNMKDISNIDPELTVDIARDMVVYGQKSDE